MFLCGVCSNSKGADPVSKCCFFCGPINNLSVPYQFVLPLIGFDLNANLFFVFPFSRQICVKGPGGHLGRRGVDGGPCKHNFVTVPAGKNTFWDSPICYWVSRFSWLSPCNRCLRCPLCSRLPPLEASTMCVAFRCYW